MIPATCLKRQHRLIGDNLILAPGGGWACRACRCASKAKYYRRRFEDRHRGHQVGVDSAGRRYCRSCLRGEYDIDEVAVERALAGEAPERLRTAERELAIVHLRAERLTYRQIAERVGCVLGTAWSTCSRLGVTDPEAARIWLERRRAA